MSAAQLQLLKRPVLLLAQKQLVVQSDVGLCDLGGNRIGEFKHWNGQGELTGSGGAPRGAVWLRATGLYLWAPGQGLRLGVGQQRGVWFWVNVVLVGGKGRVGSDGEFRLQEVGVGVQCGRGLQLR